MRNPYSLCTACVSMLSLKLKNNIQKSTMLFRWVFCMLAVSGLLTATSSAQVSTYSFTPTSGTYQQAGLGASLTPLSGCYDDNNFSLVTLPFTFTYHGTAFTSIGISANVYAKLGGVTTTTYVGVLGVQTNILSPMSANNGGSLDGDGCATGRDISYVTLGSSPNRVFVVQWTNWGWYNTGLNEYSVQIKLYETSNTVQFVYGNCPAPTSTFVNVGLNGTSTADFNVRTTTTNWAATTASGSNTGSCTLNSSVKPTSGQTFTWTSNTTVAGMAFSATSGIYVPIVAGSSATSLTTGTSCYDDNNFALATLPFTFTYAGTGFTSIGISANVYARLGAATGTYYVGVLGAQSNTLSPSSSNNGGSLDGYGCAAGRDISYITLGTSPNRIFVVQWTNWGWYSSGLNEQSVQLRLFETTNAVQFVYGNCPATTSTAVAAGLTGATTSDFNVRTTTTNWAATTAAGSNTAACTFNSSVKPANGLTFTFAPPTCTNPTAFSVTGGGDNVCANGVAVGLSSSEVNVNYQLKKDGSNTGAPVPGTGSAISFGPQYLAGTYTVVATSSVGGCVTDQTGSAVVTVIPDVVNPTISGCPSDMSLSCPGVVTFTPPTVSDDCSSSANVTQTFNYTGAVQTFTVPGGVTSITVDAQGAQGGSGTAGYGTGGNGGRIQATLAVTPGQTLNIYVGGTTTTSTGGFNGGGNGGNNTTYSAGGGGASDIRIGGTSLGDRVLVAGGGAGGGTNCFSTLQNNGGLGGGLSGGDGYQCNLQNSYNGTGGTQFAGGVSNGGLGTAGSSGTGGNGNSTYGGGGGGGYYGGGGGSYGGGGGGSAYAGTGTSAVAYTSGFKTGNGLVALTFAVSYPTITQTSGIPSGGNYPSGVTTNVFTATDGSGNTATCSFTVSISDVVVPTISDCPSDMSLSCPGVVTFTPPSVSDNCSSSSNVTQTFNFTGGVQTFTVPGGVTSLTVDARGAQGGTNASYGNGGLGGRVQATLAVTPGQVLNIYVGGTTSTTIGGFNGGGNGGSFPARGGGGASDIRIGGTGLGNRVIVAAGGGGPGADCGGLVNHGGSGGGLSGGDGYDCGTISTVYTGKGGTQSAGGAYGTDFGQGCGGAGSLGQGGNGACTYGGAGGGGYYGGGGGGYGGGGGGSSYTGSGTSGVTNTAGFQSGAGVVSISYSATYPALSQTTGIPSGGAYPQGVTTNTFVASDASGNTATCSFTVTVSDVTLPTISNCPADMSPACPGVVTFTNPTVSDDCSSSSSGSATFSYTGSAQTFTVPAGVTSITVDVQGAKGGNGYSGTEPGGLGGRVQGTLDVTPGQVLQINVGGAGNLYSFISSGAVGGFNGGGGGGWAYYGGTGGGASDIRMGGTALANRVVVAGGGGGAGYYCGGTADPGGNGGASIGGDGTACNTVNYAGFTGTGGTQSSGGTSPTCLDGNGTLGVGGGACYYYGGSGGGGYYGGGGAYAGGGGGGSNYVGGLSSVIDNAAGYSAGNGFVSFTYSINYPAIAQISGLPSGAAYPQGVTTNTFEAVDGSGNTATCSFTVSINDAEVPIFTTCTSDISVPVDAGECSAVVSYTMPEASDNCSVTITQTTGLPSGSTFPVGVTTNTFTATDLAGNSTECSFTVSVTETEAPVITNCPTDIVENNGTCNGAIVTYTTPTATDNCTSYSGSTTFDYTGTIQTYTVPNGITSIDITAKGAAGGYYPGATPGNGATMTGTFAVTPGQVLSILVGQHPGSFSGFPGGGGGTFVALGGNYTTATPLIVAGGGGGAYSGFVGVGAPTTQNGTGPVPGTNGNGAPSTNCGGGGGGFYTSGGNDLTYGLPGGQGFRQGGAGGTYSGYQSGGFGGGAPADYIGACNTTAGAGGGYSGGSGTNSGGYTGSGNAGGSYNGGTNQTNIAANNFGNGQVIISYSTPIAQTSGYPSGALFPLGTTTNTFEVSDASGNTATCSFTVTVYDNGTELTASVTQSATGGLCVGTPDTLTVNTTGGGIGQTYLWSPGGATTQQIVVTPSETTDYSVTVTDGCGAQATAGTQVVLANPTPVISPSAPSYCTGGSVTLVASSADAVTYSWSPSAGLDVTTGTTVVASPTSTTTYTVTGSAAGSSSSAITFTQSFTGGAGSSAQCTAWNTFRSQLTPNNYTKLTLKGSNDPIGVSVTDPAVIAQIAAAMNAGSAGSWTSGGHTWMTGNCGGGLELTTTSSICFCNTGYTVRPCIGNSNWGGINGATCGAASQDITVEFEIVTGCNASQTVTVTVNPVPVITASATPENICSGGSSQLDVDVITDPPAGYCIPTMFGTNPCNWINSVTTSGAITNISTAVDAGYTSTSGPGVSYFSSPFITQNLGGSFTLTVQSQGNCVNFSYYSVWVDWNQNAVFDGSELMVNNVNAFNNVTNFTINVPLGATPGSTRMRIICWGSGAPPTPCGNLSAYYGETEDYMVVIPGGGGTLTYSWSPTTFLDDPSSESPMASNVTSTTTYTVTASNGGCSSTATATVSVDPLVVTPTASVPPPAPYCIPGYSFGCTFPDVITNVTYAGINNTTGITCGQGTNLGYDPVFTSPNPTITAGTPNTISISTGGDVEGVVAYIDYNQDGIFSPSEQLLNGFAGSNPATYTATVTIPITALNGTSRLRVRCTYNQNPNSLADPPCTMVVYGETEDYVITIDGGADPNAPCSADASFQLHAGNTGGGYPYTYDWQPTTGLSDPTIEDPIASPTVTTTYTVTVNDACGSSVSGTVTTTVTPTPVVTVAPTSSTHCQGVAQTLTASGADSYTWAPVAGLSATTGSSVDATPVSTTTYTVTGTTNGCAATATATVNIIPVPVINSTTATPSNICPGGSSQLNVDAVQPAPSGYCMPQMFGANPCNYINSVTTSGGITNITTPVDAGYTSTLAPGVSYFPSVSVTQSAGSSFTLTVQSQGNCVFYSYYSVWVDWNQDVVFDPTELMVNNVNAFNDVTNFTINVPSDATPGNTRMRIICWGSGAPPGVCGNLSAYYGETEEYVVGVTGGVELTYSWSPTTGLDDATIANPIATLSSSETYTVTVSSGTCSSTSTVTVNVEPLATTPTAVVAPPSYCIPTMFATNPCNWINVVTTSGGLTNISTPVDAGYTSTTGPGVSYFANASVSQAAGSSFTLTVQSQGNCLNFSYYSVWVDWDQDGSFESSELMVNNINTGNTLTNFTINVPVDALNGTTRMRIICWGSGAPPAPCGNLSAYYGETEDYNVGVSGGVNPPAPCAGVSFLLHSNVTGGGTPYSYSWLPTTDLSDPSASDPTATPASTTTYTVTVTDNCGGSASGTVTITVQPTPVTTVSPTLAALCPGSPAIVLTASGADTYTWAPSAGLNATTGASVNASPSVNTTYIVTGTSNGCSSIATTTITVNPGLSVVATATPSSVCSGGTSQLDAVLPSSSSYCVPNYTSYDGSDYVSNVTLNTINNSSGSTPLPGYANYSGVISTTLAAGSSYSISITSGSYPFDSFSAWIDFDQDGILESGEQLGAPVSPGSFGTFSYTFTVPSGAINGTTRLRVVCRDGGAIPCPTSSYGETEDYDIIVTGGVGGGLTFDWTPTLYLDNPSIANPIASGVQGQMVYSVTVTDGNGCTATDTAAVTAADANLTFTGLDPDYCADAGAVLLTPVTPGGFFSGPGVILFGADYYFDPSTSGVGGPFTITYTFGSCGSSSQDVTVHALPSVTLDPLPSICTDAGPLLLTGGSPAGGFYFDGSGYVDGTYFYPAAAGPGIHTIYYAYTDGFGCSSLDQKDIVVEPAATVYAGNDQTICSISDATLNGSFGGSATSVTWTTAGDGTFADASDPGTTYSPGLGDKLSGSVTLTLTTNDPDGACAPASDDVVITLSLAVTYYPDMDGDGYGAGTPVVTCIQPSGYINNNLDCNDDDASVNPGMDEFCGNGIDDNCDGQIDENCVVYTYYFDEDLDTYGDPTKPTTTYSSTPPPGYVPDNTDCNDQDASIHPNQSDMCNAADDDCDGLIDEDGTFVTWYADADGDTYGDPSVSQTTCSGAPVGYVADNTDCDDTNASINPGATEQCNGIDDDCDGLVDDGVTYTTYYPDLDGDGYGSSSSLGTSLCSDPGAGFAANNLDCDDTNPAVNPAATDVCNGIDDNCDGHVDENPLVATITPSGTVSYCQLEPVTFVANTQEGLTYQWYKNGVIRPGATNPTYTTTKKGDFKVVETNGFCTSTSPTTTIVRLQILKAAITVYGNLDICSAGYVNLRANKAPNSAHAYQWSKSGLDIAGATDRDYVATSTGDYTVTVTNSNGCKTVSSPVSVTSSCKGMQPDLFSAELNLYPNPNHGDFVVELHFSDDLNAQADVQVLNTLGQTIYLNRTAVVDGKLFDEVKFGYDVAAGNYMVRVIVGDKVYTGQIVYQK